MLLEITTTYKPATDLGYLLHKHPDKLQTIELSVGNAHVFYPEANEDSCTTRLMLDITPVDLVRGQECFFAHLMRQLMELVIKKEWVQTAFALKVKVQSLKIGCAKA